MSLREIDLVSRQFQSSRDATVIRKDLNLFERDIKKESASFLAEIDRMAKKEKRSSVILLAVISD